MKIKALISMAILIGMNCNAAEPRNLVDQGRFEITYRALRKYLGTNKSDEDRQNCNVLAQLHVNILEDPRWEGPDPPNMEMDLATMLISVKRIAHLHSQHNNLIIQTAIDVIHLMQNDGELS
ncbi:MAG: hypothetical protein LBJ92_04305, partial [Holosporales bacterium]|nr:hypothetical protein [Holosporales bacterium]